MVVGCWVSGAVSLQSVLSCGHIFVDTISNIIQLFVLESKLAVCEAITSGSSLLPTQCRDAISPPKERSLFLSMKNEIDLVCSINAV